MGRKLTTDQVEKIRSLMMEDKSDREISVILKISRAAIAIYTRLIREGRVEEYLQKSRQREDSMPFYQPRNGEMPERCPDCGALVYMPCMACRIRRMVAIKQKKKYAK